MRFTVDECTGSVVAAWLRGQQHDVYSIADQDRGLDDDVILQRSVAEDRIVITVDKDFGDLVFRDALVHKGVILLRPENKSPARLIALLETLLRDHAHELPGRFVVVTDAGVRMV